MGTHRLGRAAFWLTLPLLWLYLRGSQRTRIAVVHDDSIVVVKGWLSDGKWSLPGGGLYRSETAPEGVVRELYEETGLKLTAMEIAYKETRTFSQHGLRCEYSMFIAHATSLYPLKREHFEIVEATWVKIRELSSANAAPDVLHAIQTWLL